MSVLPPASAGLLPLPLRALMVDSSSPVRDFYPSRFRTDLNGKRFKWQGEPRTPCARVDISIYRYIYMYVYVCVAATRDMPPRSHLSRPSGVTLLPFVDEERLKLVRFLSWVTQITYFGIVHSRLHGWSSHAHYSTQAVSKVTHQHSELQPRLGHDVLFMRADHLDAE